MHSIQPYLLAADVPQQIVGTFSAIKIVSGAFRSYRLYTEDPNTSSNATDARPLAINGDVIIGPFTNPWIVAEADTNDSEAGPLELLLYRGPIGMNEGHQLDLHHSIMVSKDDGLAVTSERTIGQVYRTVGTGSQVLIPELYWSGWIASDVPFRVEYRVFTAALQEFVLQAAESRRMAAASYSLNFDLAFWDCGWEKNAVGVWGAVPLPARLPVAPAEQSYLRYVSTGGAGTIAYRTAVRSR